MTTFGNATFGSPQYDNEYTFNGESYNPNIHSQYLRARYYDTVKGSFLTEDSYLGDIRNPLTLNRYSYCIGNPLFYVDTSGHFPSSNELREILNYVNKNYKYESKDVRQREYYIRAWHLFARQYLNIDQATADYVNMYDYSNPEKQREVEEMIEEAIYYRHLDICGGRPEGKMYFSYKGYKTLMEIELPTSYTELYTDEGIYVHYVHDYGITMGYGHYINEWDYNNDMIDKQIIDNNFRDVPKFESGDEGKNMRPRPVYGKEECPIMPYEMAKLLLAYDIKKYEDMIYDEAKINQNVANLKQQEYDALLIHIYRRGSITERMRELLGKEKTRKYWENEFKDSSDKIDRRYQAEINMFFDGDYEWVFSH